MPYRTSSTLLIALLCCAAPARAALILINNGLEPPEPLNVVDASDDYADDELRVRNEGCGTAEDPFAFCDSPGASTRVEVVAGGVVGNVTLQETSGLWVDGGSVGNILGTFASNTNFFDGTAGSVTVLQGARVGLYGGALTGGVTARDSSFAAIEGASIGWTALVEDTATLRLFAGSIGLSLVARGSSIFEMFGGVIGESLLVRDTAVATIHGSDFRVDGTRVRPGSLSATSGVLTATLDNADPLDVPFARDAGAQILLVPEPARALAVTVALATLAACCVLSRRWRRRSEPSTAAADHTAVLR